MCEVISCDKRGKGRLHISETFLTFFFGTGKWVVVVVVVFFWREKDEWRQLIDTTDKRAII